MAEDIKHLMNMIKPASTNLWERPCERSYI